MRDLPIDAVKTGMLSNPAIIAPSASVCKPLAWRSWLGTQSWWPRAVRLFSARKQKAELIEQTPPLAYV